MDTYDTMCFACGKQNPKGLHLEFTEVEDGVYTTTFTPGEEHQGYPGIMHGGLTATILDEVTARYIWAKGIVAFTASLNIRYRTAIPIGKPVKFTGILTAQKGRMYEMEGTAVLEDGTVAATAEVKIMKAKSSSS